MPNGVMGFAFLTTLKQLMTVDVSAKKITGGFSDIKLDAIFHHPDCRKMFEDKVGVLRISDSAESALLVAAYSKVHMLVPCSQLNLTDEEFDQLHGAVTDCNLDIHTGIVLKMIQLVGHTQPKDYASDPAEYLSIKHASDSVKKEINDLIAPLRDECIEEFYMSATPEQVDDIRLREKEAIKASEHPMPGNPQGMQQFQFNGRR